MIEVEDVPSRNYRTMHAGKSWADRERKLFANSVSHTSDSLDNHLAARNCGLHNSPAGVARLSSREGLAPALGRKGLSYRIRLISQ